MTGGGTEKVIAILANHWVKKGYKITILMIGGDDVAYELDERITVRYLSGATGGSNKSRLDRVKAMRRAFKEDKKAVIIGMGSISSMFSVIAATGLPNKVIVTERNDPNVLNHRPIKCYERLIRNNLYYMSDGIVFQTEMARACFPKAFKYMSTVIMNPLADKLPQPTPYKERDKVVMTAGRLAAQKNHKMLIDAFEQFHQVNQDYTLNIFGEGELKAELEQYVADKGASEYICLKGFSDKIHDEMNRSRIYVSSSDWEGISNSLMEALAMGMVVIATDCPMGGSAMLIDNGINGELIEIGNTEQLTEKLCSLADASDAELVARRATEVTTKCSVDMIAHIWERFMDWIAG